MTDSPEGERPLPPRVPAFPPPDPDAPHPPEPSRAGTTEPSAPGVPGPDDVGATLPFGEPVPVATPPAPEPAAVSTPGSPDTADLDLPSREQHLLRRLLGERTLELDATVRARIYGWLGPLLVTALAGVVRFVNLGRPQKLVFDETYYVKQGYTYFRVGYDADWPKEDDTNLRFETGDMDIYLSSGDYVVHPPVGKWLISWGFYLGDPAHAATWRMTTAILGTLAVLILARTARRLFASTALGVVAGFLLAIDGAAIVHSRTTLLDNVLMFFVLAGFALLVLDRQQARRRLALRVAGAIDADSLGSFGPGLGIRWYRIAAAVALGLAVGTKWSGLYFLAVFALLSVLWDITARRRAGVERWFTGGVVRDGLVAAAVMLPTAAVVYLASWTGWFRTEETYGRRWAEQNPGEGITWLPDSLNSWWKYHLDMWAFHNNLTSEHSYQAHPIGWLVQWRPTSFFWADDLPEPGYEACGWERCAAAVTSLGNPLIWWGATLAIFAALYWLVRYRDWRALAALSGIAAGWLPWLGYSHRTAFTFYTIVFLPWMVLTLTYALGRIAGPPDAPRHRRDRGIVTVTAFCLLALLVSIFFYPVWTAQVIPLRFWQLHVWLPSWV